MNVVSIGSIISRILITYALLYQVLYMLYYNSKKIFASTFYVFAIGAFIMSYMYFLEDNKMTSRTYFKLINASLLLSIGFLIMK